MVAQHSRRRGPFARVVSATLAVVVLAAFAVGQTRADRIYETGFEGVPAGPTTAWGADEARWSAPADHVTIHADHRKSGRQCLRLLGRDVESRAVLTLASPEPAHELSFWAERWTRREPFRFAVDVSSEPTGEAWREAWVGDGTIRIGGFLTHVRVPLGGRPVARLRFRTSAASGGGCMLDDLRVTRPAPMQVAAITVERVEAPALRDRVTPLFHVHVETTGNTSPRRLRSVDLDLHGTTDRDDIQELQLWIQRPTVASIDWRDPRAVAAGLEPFGPSFDAMGKPQTVTGTHVLEPGRNTLWLTARVAPTASLDRRVGARCHALSLDGIADGRTVRREIDPAAQPEVGKRIGESLRTAGDDGCSVYRIPGLATTNAGTLLAVFDVRWRGWADLPGDIDVGVRRSADGGRTWSPMQIAVDCGRDESARFDGVGDPSILVDRTTGRVWIAALWSHGNRAWNGSQRGLDPEQTGQFVLVHSDDDGRTWSAPQNITRSVKRAEWRLFLQGPGKGISMRDGTLVFPAQYRDADGLPHATVLVSDDHGATWRVGTGAKPDTTESQVVELDDGVLMLNMRDNRGGSRSVYTTRDLGRTWQEHPTSRRALVEPVCMASLIRVDALADADRRPELLFCNPAVTDRPRRAISIQLSPDEGASWRTEHRLLLDAGASAGYSCLSMIDADTVGCLFEGSQAHLTFVRVPLAELLPPR